MDPSPHRESPPSFPHPASSGGGIDAATSDSHGSSPPLPPSSTGTRYYHHYEVCLREDGTTLHELGRGAMGVSYKARDINLDTPVAIKVINAGQPTQSQARERFRREARAAAQLRHPNVASVFHFGETPGGEVFYAMEFIEGETLAARVRRDGPLPAAQVVEIALQVTAALVAADERGLVHRDLKPANLMLVAQPIRHRPGSRGGSGAGSSPWAAQHPTVKVIDFGLAKAAADAGAATQIDAPLTQVGGFLGTPAYASPEQAEGGAVDTRSDIYSLGVTLWYLLTGRVPFPGRSLSEIYDRQMRRKLPVAQLAERGVPPSLAELLTSMLAPEAHRRPSSPAALYEALEICREETAGSPRAARPPGAGAGSRPVGRSRRRPVAAMAALAILLLAGGGAAAFFLLHHRAAPESTNANAGAASITTPLVDKSIAVLPLEDFSEDKENAYFADGIQDDLLSRLSKIKDLKVISRSSVMGYRNVAARNLHDIAQQLGVTTILEGSVRRAPDRVLVNVSLIDTGSGRQLWAEHYDRTLADSLTLQGEVATEIAAALRATLSPEEKARVEDPPTANADAYVLYLRARDYQTRPYTLLQDYQTAERLYREALALDPDFALAHAQLSATLAYIYLNFQPTAEIRDQARGEAEAAQRLRPDSGEGNLARALCLYMTEKKYDDALRELDLAARLLPGNADVDLYSGAIRRRQGHWTQALAHMKRAQVRDPRSARIAREILMTECLTRDWANAGRDGARAVSLAPDDPMIHIEHSYVDFWSSRELGALRAVLAAVPAGVNPDGEITFFSWDTAMMARDFAGAERALTAPGAPETVVSPFGASLPKNYLLGCTALARGDAGAARPLFEAAGATMEAEARSFPLDPFRQAQLGLLYAFLGRKEEALQHGRRAVELFPETKDALTGPLVSGMMALIYARTGENDQAVALIERLLRTPGPVLVIFDGSITRSDLRMRWQWDPLRGDARFRALLAAPEPKTVFQ